MDQKSYKLWSKLVSTGYFPEELPPCFTTEDMSKVIKGPKYNLEKYQQKKDDLAAPASSKLLTFSIPHIRGYRRVLGIPGPFHYTQLAKSIIECRDEISKIHALSKLSIYKDHFASDINNRYIPKPDFKEFVEKRILKSAGYRYLLHVDIARFYPSIYTHSIPWATHTKNEAKKDFSHNLFGNKLDIYARNCQDKQTMGLPIGPDSSRILSEIILAQIDHSLQEADLNISGIRNVDDYYLFFTSYSEAQRGRTILQNHLREYELELNVSKERIIELPEIVESEWRTLIRYFKFRTKDEQQRTDLIAYFDLAFNLVRKYPDDQLLPYAIAKLRSLEISPRNSNIFQALLLNAIVLESKAVVQVIQLLLKNNLRDDGIHLNVRMLKKAFESFLLFHADHNHHYEIVWVLWFHYQTKITLSSKICSKLNNSTNDFVILMLLALEQEELTKAELDTKAWNDLACEENLFTEHWLLAYEGMSGQWIKSDIEIIDNKYFKDLQLSNVRFFKPTDEYKEHFLIDSPESSLAKESEENDDEGNVDFSEDDD